MKRKILLLVFSLMSVLFIASCGKTEGPTGDVPSGPTTDTAPVISGAVDKTIEKGTKFVPLDGITATDAEDGDLTSEIQYSGNINVNKEGTYKATYTVYDSDGNEASVTVTIKVVYTDTAAPLISGAADTTIFVGTEFGTRDGVSATDGIDGNVTSTMEVIGDVDVWTPGVYEVVYKAADKSGNVAEQKRTVTVALKSFGEYVFNNNVITATYAEGKLSQTVSSGDFNTELNKFGLAQLTFKASSPEASELAFNLEGATHKGNLAITATETAYTVYFRLDKAVKDAKFEITGAANAVLKDVELKFGSAQDLEAPVITLPENYKVVLPNTLTDKAALSQFVLAGVEANDNLDQIVTSKLTVDFGSLKLGDKTLVTEEEVTLKCTDKAGNEATKVVKVQFMNVYDSGIIKDSGFDQARPNIDKQTPDYKPVNGDWGINGGNGKGLIEFKDGVMIHQTTAEVDAGWDSASSPFIRFDKGTFQAQNYYLLAFQAKANVERNMEVRIGLDTTEAKNWIEDFAGASNPMFKVTTELQWYYVLFYVHSDVSEGGLDTIKMELKLGTHYYGSNERKNPVTIDNLQFFLVTNEDRAPKLTIDETLPTTFGKGETVDFTKYVKAYDMEDAAEITITEAMIDASSVNMSKAGEYAVTYKVKDSKGNEATTKLYIKVLENADTTKPVIATVEGLQTTMKQFSNTINLLEAVTISDDLDAFEDLKITIDGKVDTNVAGTYDVVYTVKDTSGNVATHTITFTVTDAEAPVIVPNTTRIVNDKIQVKVGSSLNLTKLVKVTDNFDKELTVTADNVKTPEGLFVDGVITSVLGEYVVEYAIKDAAGNEVNYELTVIVVEEVINSETWKVDSVAQGKSAFEFSDDMLTVKSTHGKNVDSGAWGRWDITSPSVAYTDVKVTILPKTTLTLVIKVDANGNPYDGIKGNKITKTVKANELAVFEWDLTALNIDSKKLIKVVFYAYDSTEATTEGEFELKGIEFFKNNKMPTMPEKTVDANITGVAQDAGNKYVFSQGNLVVSANYTTQVAKWAKWEFEKPTESYTNAMAIFKGTDMALGAKLDTGSKYDSLKGNKTFKTLNGYTVFEWDLKALGMDATLLDKLVVWAYDPTGITSFGTFELVELVFYGVEQKVETELITENVTPTGWAQTTGATAYTVDLATKTITNSKYGTSMGNWVKLDFAALPADTVKVIIKVKAITALGFSIKVDTANNTYHELKKDGSVVNPVHKTATAGQEITVEWDLKALGMDPTKIVKTSLWLYDKSGATTSGSLQVLAIQAVREVEKQPVKTELVTENVTPTGWAQTTGATAYTVDLATKTITNSKYGTSMGNWVKLDFAALPADTVKVIIKVKAITALGFSIKVDTASNSYHELKKDGSVVNPVHKTATAGQEVTVEWDLKALGMDPTKLVKTSLWLYDKTGATTSGSLQVLAIQAVREVEVTAPKTELKTENLTVKSFVGQNNKYTLDQATNTITCSSYGKDIGSWAILNFDALSADTQKVIIKIKAVSTVNISIKVDNSNNGNHGNANILLHKKIEANGELTITWDLKAQNIDPTSIIKCSMSLYDKSGATTTGAIQVLSLQVVREVEVQ